MLFSLSKWCHCYSKWELIFLFCHNNLVIQLGMLKFVSAGCDMLHYTVETWYWPYYIIYACLILLLAQFLWIDLVKLLQWVRLAIFRSPIWNTLLISRLKYFMYLYSLLYVPFYQVDLWKFSAKQGRFKYVPGQVRAFGMLAGGSGITPMFQVCICDRYINFFGCFIVGKYFSSFLHLL